MMGSELLYVDRETGKRLDEGSLPRSETGLITFLSLVEKCTYGVDSQKSWDSIYLQRHGKQPVDVSHDAGEKTPPPLMSVKLRSLPYFRHLIDLSSVLRRGIPALEVGCGTAGTSLELASEFGFIPYGVDISEIAISEASRKFVQYGLDPATLSIADVTNLPFENDTFPLIFGKTVFEHFDHPRQASREIFRVTAPGGYVVMDVPNSRKAYWTLASERARSHTHTTNTFSIEEFRLFFEDAGFSINQTWGSWVFYTTPYILLSELRRFRQKQTVKGANKEGNQSPEPQKKITALKPSLRMLMAPILLADSLFKAGARKVNELFDKLGWTTTQNGVLIGIVAQKPVSGSL